MFDKIKKFVSFVATEADRVQGAIEFEKKQEKQDSQLKDSLS